MPVVAVASAAPALAASAPPCTTCSTQTLSWGAETSAPAIPRTYTLTNSCGQPLYACVSYVQTATGDSNTAKYQLGIGKSAYGTAVGTYTMTTTGGGNDIIFNQTANSTGLTTAVTVTFSSTNCSNGGAITPVYVSNLKVPLDDFSSGRSWDSAFLCGSASVLANRSYEEAWSVQGTAATGTVTASADSLTNPYGNSNSKLSNLSGSGTPASPWYFSSQNLTSCSNTTTSTNSVGGTLNTSFSVPVSSVTITYGSNPTSYAQSSGFTGDQGAGIGQLSLCI